VKKCPCILILAAAFLLSCKDDSSKKEYDLEDEDYIYGPKGGEITAGDSTRTYYGTRIVIQPGALDNLRSFWIEDAYGLTPYTPAGFIQWQDRRTVLSLNTGYDPPYNLLMNFYFPVAGMKVEAGEIACIFAYDKEPDKWTLVLPDSMNKGVLAATATYHRYWMYGKIVLDQVEKQYLIAAVNQQYGSGTWEAMSARIAEIYNKPEVRSLKANCRSLISFRDGFLNAMTQTYQTRLAGFQVQFSACGSCDLLSDQFFDEAMTYFKNRLQFEWYKLLANSYGKGGDVVELIMLWKMIDLCEENRALACDYRCVTEKGGLAFWTDFTGYHMTGLLQRLITLSLAQGWIKC